MTWFLKDETVGWNTFKRCTKNILTYRIIYNNKGRLLLQGSCRACVSRTWITEWYSDEILSTATAKSKKLRWYVGTDKNRKFLWLCENVLRASIWKTLVFVYLALNKICEVGIKCHIPYIKYGKFRIVIF